MKKRWIYLVWPFFLAACRNNQRIIDEAMRNVGGQSGYVANLPDPRPLWPWLLGLFFLSFLLIMGGIAYALSQKKPQKKKTTTRPQRTTRIYLPQQYGNQYRQLPPRGHSPQEPWPPSPPPDLPY